MEVAAERAAPSVGEALDAEEPVELLPEGGGLALAYSNTVSPRRYHAYHFLDYLLADDCTLACGGMPMEQYEFVLRNRTSGAKSCTVSLWTGTTQPGTVIPNTSRTVTTTSGYGWQTFTQVFTPSVTLPNKVFVVFDLASNDLGVSIAEEAELGYTDSVWYYRPKLGGPWIAGDFPTDTESVRSRHCEEYHEPPQMPEPCDALPYIGLWFRIWVDTGPAICGNGIREGCEECDGTDNANCHGTVCKSDCTCSCMLTCPPGAHIENEPCGTSANGSCPDAEPIACDVPVCGTCYSTISLRDIDWYKITTAVDSKYTMTITAEFGVIAGLAEYNPGYEGSGDCNQWTGYIRPSVTANACVEKTLNVPCMRGGIYWFWVSKTWEDWPCNNPYGEIDYVMQVDCEPCYEFCPANTLFGQPVAGPDENWTAGVSDFEFGSIRYEKFWDLYGDICDLHWWGVTAWLGGGNTGEGFLKSVTCKPPWSPCVESPMEFQVWFYEDAGGQPGTVKATYNVVVTPVATGDLYAGFPLYYFSTALTPCIDPGLLYNGWVSIQAVDTTPEGCYFLWMSADETDGKSLLFDGTTWTTEAFDLSVCITGNPHDPIGACCDTTFGLAECFDNLPLSLCQGPSLRFQAGAECWKCSISGRQCDGPEASCPPGEGVCEGTMEPPCGYGTCCLPGTERECTYFQNEAECTNLGGTWHDPAEGLLCEPINPCPCDLWCPPGSVAEQEGCGDDTNGGCNMSTPAFEPIAYNSTVCGTAWCDGSTRDTDWYVFTLTEPQGVSWDMTAEFPSRVFAIDAGSGNCLDYTILGSDTTGVCETAEVTVSLDAGTYWLWAGPRDWDTIITCGDNDLYFAKLVVEEPPPVCGNSVREGDEECDGTDDGACPGHCLPDCTCEPCPAQTYFIPFPPDGITDATQPHPINAGTPCKGIGMPGTPPWQPIVVILGVSGADQVRCWELCETGYSPQCGPNSITSVVEGPAGVYTINLAHGISAYDVGAPAPALGVGHVTTIRYNGGAFVKYYKHPANVDGSSFTNAQDITQLIQRLNIALGGGSVPLWEADINQSGTITVADLTTEINLLTGAGLYDIWFGTPKPTGAGCP